MLTGKPLDRRKSPRIETNGELPGRVLDNASGAEIQCRSIDVSCLGLGIETEAELALDARLTLENNDSKVTLRVVSRTLTPSTTRIMRYGLIVESDDFNLEDLFRRHQLVAKVLKGRAVPGVAGLSDRAPRFLPDQELKLEASTFGTKVAYQLVIENLSRSGLLVGLVISEHLPFRVSTLLDMVIDPKAEIFKKSIRATGKIVRRVDEDVPKKEAKQKAMYAVRLGIVIVEVDPRDETQWNQALNTLEAPS